MKQLVKQVEAEEKTRDLSGVSFDQRKFPELPNGKIIFTEDVFHRILQLLKFTKLTGVEQGMFFYGHEIGDNLMMIDTVSQCEFVSGKKEIVVGNLAACELLSKLDHDYDVVLHFHTHPSYENCCSRNFSDQDLYLYGYGQVNPALQSKNVSFIGGMGCFSGASSELNFVSYDAHKKNYFRISDVYYYTDADIMKVCSLDSIPTIHYDTVRCASSLEKIKLLGQMY